MSLIDELSNLDEPLVRGPRCSIALLLEKLTDAEKTALIGAIDNSNLTYSSIARALNRAGHKVLPTTIKRHRQRGTSDGCRCAR